MKIVKYILLLLVLILTATAVFVFTKDGKYHIEKSKIINIPKATILSYIKDLKNNSAYNAWQNELLSIVNVNSTTNDSLHQKLTFIDKTSNIKWFLKDTVGGTKVSMFTNGESEFKDKLLSLINKEEKTNFAEKFELQLATINTILTTEINTFNIKLDGFISRDTIFYIQKIVACKEVDLPKNIKIVLPKLTSLLKSTGTKSNGSPFVIYHSRDTIQKTINFSIAIPTVNKVFTSSESDIFTGQTNPYQAVKATLTGNYIHKPKAIKQIFAFMEKNKLEQSDRHKEVDVIPSNSTNDKSAAKWVTEIIIPVRPKKVIYKPRVIADTLSVSKMSREN